ncbi:MAG: hypothetical protein WAQ24_02250 [Candidatus Saccharimonadales bacterium]
MVEQFTPPSVQGVLPVLTNEFRSFYDPQREYPRNQGQKLIQWMCEGRSNAPGEVRRSIGARVIAREMAHVRMIAYGRHDNAIGLGLESDELNNLVDLSYYDAHKTVTVLSRSVDLLYRENPRIAELAAAQDPSRIITLGAMGSAVSHAAQKRRSGRDYAEHPWESVMIAEVAEARAFPNGVPAEARLTSMILRYLIYSHDELEDDMSSNAKERNHSFIKGTKLHMTPLVHYLLLQACGAPEDVADYTSDGLVRLTKTVGPGGRREWRDYIRELSSAAPVAPVGYEGTVTSAKNTEMHHNAVIDKDPPPKRRGQSRDAYRDAKHTQYRRTGDYQWAAKQLSSYREDMRGYPAEYAKHIKGVSKYDVAQYKKQSRLVPALTPALLVTAYNRSQNIAA